MAAGRRIEYLDGLRGIAALAVVLQHTAGTIMASDPASVTVLKPFFSSYFNAGRFGIALFFFISGFVIPFSFKYPHPIRGFVLSRVFRLYPAYWASLAIAVALFPTLTGNHFTLLQILANSTMAQAVFSQADVIGAYWTLLIELIFYMLCAALFAARLLSDRRCLAAAALICLLASLSMSAYAAFSGSHLPANVFVNLATMFLGTLMRRGWLEQDLAARRMIVPVAAMWALLLPPILWMMPSRPWMPIEPLSFCLGYWMALATFVAAVRFRRPRGRHLLALGTVSYSLYLFHGICLEILRVLIPPTAPVWDIAFACGLLASSIAIAVLAYRGVERPFIRAGHAIVNRIGLVPALRPEIARSP
jgi:peptidoglycan/LPS O-acetylase OafA/YrhL